MHQENSCKLRAGQAYWLLDLRDFQTWRGSRSKLKEFIPHEVCWLCFSTHLWPEIRKDRYSGNWTLVRFSEMLRRLIIYEGYRTRSYPSTLRRGELSHTPGVNLSFWKLEKKRGGGRKKTALGHQGDNGDQGYLWVNWVFSGQQKVGHFAAFWRPTGELTRHEKLKQFSVSPFHLPWQLGIIW